MPRWVEGVQGLGSGDRSRRASSGVGVLGGGGNHWGGGGGTGNPPKKRNKLHKDKIVVLSSPFQLEHSWLWKAHSRSPPIWVLALTPSESREKRNPHVREETKARWLSAPLLKA